MVCEIQSIDSIFGKKRRRSLNRARKASVRWVKGCFPHLGEFIHDVWYRGLVGLVIHEEENSFAGKDEFRENRPIRDRHGNLRGDISVLN